MVLIVHSEKSKRLKWRNTSKPSFLKSGFPVPLSLTAAVEDSKAVLYIFTKSLFSSYRKQTKIQNEKIMIKLQHTSQIGYPRVVLFFTFLLSKRKNCSIVKTTFVSNNVFFLTVLNSAC